MFGVTLAIIFAGFTIADAIMFVNGYKGYLCAARTDQEKAVRSRWFRDREIEWDEKNE